MKTSLAPGSTVVTEYLEKSGLDKYLDELQFNLVGYGCTTCIGNSGPLPEEISKAVNDNDLVVCSVLSGNRNFEGRINPDTRANYLASPPLVVAYALAGRMDIDLTTEPLGRDSDGEPVHLADIWPSSEEIKQVVGEAVRADMFTKSYADVFTGDERWREIEVPEGDRYTWPDSTYVRKPPFFEGMDPEPKPVEPIQGARVLAVLGDSVTTDHISPAGAIKKDSPAGRWLIEQGVEVRDFNSYGVAPRQPRGDDPRHLRQRPAPQPAWSRRRAASPGTSPDGRGDDDLRGGDEATPTRACRSSCSPARSTARAPRATGPRRARSCSASAP